MIRVMVFDTTFNSFFVTVTIFCVIFYYPIKRLWLWCLTLFSIIFQLFPGSQVEETGVLRDIHRPVASH